MKTKQNWFKNLLSRRTSRSSAETLSPPPGPTKSAEEARSDEALMAIITEYDAAVAKHPFFAHTVFDSFATKEGSALLLYHWRSALDARIADGDCSGTDVLECELAEAQEAYSRGDYAHCYQELAQVGAVVLRMMLDVQKMRLQPYVNAELGGIDRNALLTHHTLYAKDKGDVDTTPPSSCDGFTPARAISSVYNLAMLANADRVAEAAKEAMEKEGAGDIVGPSTVVTAEMIAIAKTNDPWHFAQNLNAMMRLGYCRKCHMVPEGCMRDGCGAQAVIDASRAK